MQTDRTQEEPRQLGLRQRQVAGPRGEGKSAMERPAEKERKERRWIAEVHLEIFLYVVSFVSLTQSHSPIKLQIAN